MNLNHDKLPPLDVPTLRWVADKLTAQAADLDRRRVGCRDPGSLCWDARAFRIRAQWLRNLATRIEKQRAALAVDRGPVPDLPGNLDSGVGLAYRLGLEAETNDRDPMSGPHAGRVDADGTRPQPEEPTRSVKPAKREVGDD